MATLTHDAEYACAFDVDVWIDFPNQVSHFYGGYGPGLYFWVDASDIERFASQLGAELHAIGAFLHRGEVKGKGLLQDEEDNKKDEEIKRIILDLPIDILYAGVVGSSVVREGKDVDVVVIAERDEKPMLFHEGMISVLTLGREWLIKKKRYEQRDRKNYLVALIF